MVCFILPNGGISWTNIKVYSQDFNNGNGGYLYPHAHPSNYPRKWIVNPDNSQIMYLLTFSSVLKSIDGGANWEILYTTEFDYWKHEQSFNDIEFDPDDPSIFYVSGPEIYRFTNDGNNMVN